MQTRVVDRDGRLVGQTLDHGDLLVGVDPFLSRLEHEDDADRLVAEARRHGRVWWCCPTPPWSAASPGRCGVGALLDEVLTTLQDGPVDRPVVEGQRLAEAVPPRRHRLVEGACHDRVLVAQVLVDDDLGRAQHLAGASRHEREGVFEPRRRGDGVARLEQRRQPCVLLVALAQRARRVQTDGRLLRQRDRQVSLGFREDALALRLGEDHDPQRLVAEAERHAQAAHLVVGDHLGAIVGVEVGVGEVLFEEAALQDQLSATRILVDWDDVADLGGVAGRRDLVVSLAAQGVGDGVIDEDDAVGRAQCDSRRARDHLEDLVGADGRGDRAPGLAQGDEHPPPVRRWRRWTRRADAARDRLRHPHGCARARRA